MPCLYLLSCQVNKEQENHPNIIIVLTDDQGWGDLGIHGNDSIFTPNIDTFAIEGIQLKNFFVSSVCAPTRASLLTGRYHLRTGTSWVTHRKEVMRENERTIAEILKNHGYHTGIFGKWHNGEQFPNDPNGQGFDNFFGFTAGHWNNYFNTTLQYNHAPVATKGYITDVLTDSALAFIERHHNQPFFCYIPYNAPHGPFQVPDKYFDKYKSLGLSDKNAAVYGMCEHIDDNFGRILQRLDNLHIRENTIVVFMTDNGPNGARYNGGMRGTKASMHEGGVRVPGFIQWKERLPEGLEVAPLAAHIDLLPTLLELAGIPIPDDLQIDGKSLVPLFNEQAADWPERMIFHAFSEGNLPPLRGAVRTERYRVVFDHQGPASLFDMIADPGQKNDLADSLIQLKDSLTTAYQLWLKNVTENGIDIPPIPIGYSESPKVHLPAPESKLLGNALFKGRMGWANDYIINLLNVGDGASWKIKVVTSGNYRLHLLYAANQSAVGAKFVVTIADEKKSAAISEAFNPEALPSPDRVPRGEVYEKKWAVLNLPEFKLHPGEFEIKLELEQDLPTGALLEIKGLELIH